MKQHFKRLISLLCIVAILFCALPLQVLAEEVPSCTTSAVNTPKTSQQEYTLEVQNEPPIGMTASAVTTAAVTSGNFTYIVLSDDSAQITGYSGLAANLTIPDTLDGHVVTSIGSKAFSWKSTITNIVFPDSMITIGVLAFVGCKSLKSVSFPSTLTAIYGSAFSGCSALTSVELPDSITTLGARAFANCTSLTAINYPKSWNFVSSEDSTNWSRDIYSIGHYESPFIGCSALKSLDIPEGTTQIPMFAFNSASFRSISLPNSLTSIGQYAFYKCSSLESISFPDSITSIPPLAFVGCKSLKSVSFPSTLTAIYGSAFSGCSALTSVELPDSITTLGARAFADCTSLTAINYPKSWNFVSSKDGSNCSRDIYSISYYESPFIGCSALKSIDIPEETTQIPMFAFNRASIISIALPSTLRTIEDYAFYGASNLCELWIPQDVSVIGDSAFRNIPDLTVSCNLVSSAIWCALENGYNIRPIVDSTKYLERSSSILSYPQCNFSYISASDQINSSMICTLTYAVNDEGFASAQNMQMQIQIPPSLSISERAGILLNGEQVPCNIENRIITVDITEQCGTITFYTTPRSAGAMICCARILYQLGGTKKQEPVASFYSDLPTLFFEAPTRTSERTFSVSGVTEQGKEILLYLDDHLIGNTTAKKDGTYSFSVSLPENSSVGSQYTLRAVWSDNSEISATQTVLLQSDIPKLIQFDMKIGRSTYDLLSFSGGKKVITWYSSAPLQFTIRFENPEKLAKVYVTSTKNGITHRILATATETPGLYTAAAPFEGTSLNYQPGTLDVAYTELTTEEDICQVQPLPEALRNASVDVIADTDTEYHAIVTADAGVMDIHSQSLSISDFRYFLFPDEPQTHAMRAATSNSDNEDIEIVESILKDYAKAYGGNVVSNAKDTVTYQSEDKNAFYYIVWDSASNAALTTSIKVGGTLAVAESSAVDWTTAKSGWGVMFSAFTTTLQGYFDMVRIDQVERDIKAQNFSPQDTVYALHQAEKIRCAYGALRVGHFVLGLASTGLIKSAIAGLCLTGPAGIVAGAAMTLLASYMLNSVTDLAENYLDASLAYYASGNQGSSIKWMTDPSGYVYDIDTGIRLSGVTATAYWIENDDSESFWDTPPSVDQYGLLWDSQEYSNQQNPLITDQNGCYAWVVPDGWWRVKYEKAGYKTVWSEWMPVPPEQTEVNIGMMPTASSTYSFRPVSVTQTAATVRISNSANLSSVVRCILAVYDAAGRMLTFSVFSQTLTAGGSCELTIGYSQTSGASNIKAFLLDSASNTPLRQSWQIAIPLR